MDSCKRSGSGQEFTSPSAIDASLCVRPTKGDAQSRASLVRDRMKCQQCLTHPPVAAVGQIFERHLNVLAKDAPLLTEEIGDRGALAVLDPTAPISARVLDCLGPIGQAIGRPCRVAGWRQHEPIRLRVVQDHVGQGEQIGGPFEDLVRDLASAQGEPHRRRRRISRAGVGRRDSRCGTAH